MASLNVTNIIAAIRHSIQSGVPVFVGGATGVGKSAATYNAISTPITVPIFDKKRQLKELKVLQYRVQTLRMASKDETDLEGIPFVDKDAGKTHYGLPPMLVDPKATYEQVPPTVYFCDEINRWPSQVRQTLMGAFHDNDGTGRYFGEHRIRDLDRIVAAFNPASDGYDVEELDQALLCRGTQLVADGSKKEWRQWANGSKIDPELIEFFISGDDMDMKTDFKPSTKKNPRTCELAAHTYMTWKVLPETDRCAQSVVVEFIAGLIGSQAYNLVPFLNEKSDRPIPAVELMGNTPTEVKKYMSGLKTRNRNDVFSVLKDGMSSFLNDKANEFKKTGLNLPQKEVILTFLEGLPKDILSAMLTDEMSSNTVAGELFNELASTPKTQERMGKLMEQAMQLA